MTARGRIAAVSIGAALAAATLVGAGAAPVAAQPPAKAVPHRAVVLAPLSTLGSESTAAPIRKLGGDLEAALGQVPGMKVIGSATAVDAIKQAKKPALRSCDGDPGCLAELGRLVDADWVVYGEVGGLGDVQVVYLVLVDVGTGREVRSTTLQLGGGADLEGGPRGAAVRLLAPERFMGKLAVTVDVPGASIYVDGKKLARSPAPALPLPVGPHALRVTHPEFRDFVRFVDVPFDRAADVQVGLQGFGVVERDLQSNTGAAVRRDYTQTSIDEPAWYRRWWAIAGFGAILVTGAAITAGVLADGTDADQVRPVPPPP